MMRSLYSAVSGLKTHQTRMDVIGNNIANVNTEAFKASNVRFSEIFFIIHILQKTKKMRFLRNILREAHF